MKSRSEIIELLSASVQKISSKHFSGKKIISDDQDFSDYGLDSLDRMSLMIAVEEAIGLELSEVDPEQFRNLNDYVAFIQNAKPEAWTSSSK